MSKLCKIILMLTVLLEVRGKSRVDLAFFYNIYVFPLWGLFNQSVLNIGPIAYIEIVWLKPCINFK